MNQAFNRYLSLFGLILILTVFAANRVAGKPRSTPAGEPTTALASRKGTPVGAPDPGSKITRHEIASLEKATRELRVAFLAALREYLLSNPEMTPAEEDSARAQFLRANFEWRLEIAEREEALRDAKIAFAAQDPAEPDRTDDLEQTVEDLRSHSRSDRDRRAVEGYRRTSAEILLLEENADRARHESD